MNKFFTYVRKNLCTILCVLIIVGLSCKCLKPTIENMNGGDGNGNGNAQNKDLAYLLLGLLVVVVIVVIVKKRKQ